MNTIFKNIFNYKSFIGKRKNLWCAQKLCSKIKYKTCPYCQLKSIEADHIDLENSFGIKPKKSSRATLDHYYDKARYPFLSLTLGNLIPSCSDCNSTYKASVNFFSNQHLNPMLDEESINFKMDLSNSQTINEIPDIFCALATAKNPNCQKTARSLNTFDLANRYSKIATTATRIWRLGRSIKRENSSITAIFQIPSDYYIEIGVNTSIQDNYKNQVCGKMIVDLIEFCVKA